MVIVSVLVLIGRGREEVDEGAAVGEPTTEVGESALGEVNASGRDDGGKVDEPAREVGECEKAGESSRGKEDGCAEGAEGWRGGEGLKEGLIVAEPTREVGESRPGDVDRGESDG